MPGLPHGDITLQLCLKKTLWTLCAVVDLVFPCPWAEKICCCNLFAWNKHWNDKRSERGVIFIPKCPPSMASVNSGRGMDWMECLLGVTTARVQGRAMSTYLGLGLWLVKMHSTEHLIQHKQLQQRFIVALLPINLLKWKLSNAQHCLNRNDSYFSATHRLQNHRCQKPSLWYLPKVTASKQFSI